jgi:hypothetical protein
LCVFVRRFSSIPSTTGTLLQKPDVAGALGEKGRHYLARIPRQHATDMAELIELLSLAKVSRDSLRMTTVDVTIASASPTSCVSATRSAGSAGQYPVGHDGLGNCGCF